VILTGVEDSSKPGADYINANYINHEEESVSVCGAPFKQYIATQGCVGGTRQHLYHMIWQENSLLVVMTTKVMERGKTKCARYWPELDQTETYGAFTVNNVSEETSKDYTLREFLVTKADVSEQRRIFHYHFLGWPDHGTPEDPGSVLNFLHDVNNKQESLEGAGPIVVHCSAGIGRTGTFIVIDMIIDQIQTRGLDCEIDIQRTIQMVRSQRSGMVQTEAQYKFVYLAVQHHIDTLSQRLAAEQKSQLVGREYTNIKYSSELAGGLDHMRTPLARSTLSLVSSSRAINNRSNSSTSLLPRPPDEIPRAFYENINKDKDVGPSNGVLVDLNIGPPPSFAPPAPPGKDM